jgi:hypothetical protein
MQAPRPEYVRSRLDETRGIDIYFRADPAVRVVFDACRSNCDDCNVIAKVAVLNALYATRIMNIYPVVDRILELKPDDRLRAGDETLVGDLARVRLGKRTRVLLSFASKYCAWHEPDKFQIFDSRVEAMLWGYQRKFGFSKFRRWELRDYPTFARVVADLRKHFGLGEFSRKDIDKFLWIEGA